MSFSSDFSQNTPKLENQSPARMFSWIFHRHPNLKIFKNSIYHLSHPICYLLPILQMLGLLVPTIKKLDIDLSQYLITQVVPIFSLQILSPFSSQQILTWTPLNHQHGNFMWSMKASTIWWLPTFPILLSCTQ